MAPFVEIRIAWTPAAPIPAFMIALAAIGVSLIIAGATLIWKRIQLVNDFVLTMVMLFSASAIPLIAVPGWWTASSHFFPLTDGVGSLYRTLFTDQPVTDPWGLAKRRGTLGRY